MVDTLRLMSSSHDRMPTELSASRMVGLTVLMHASHLSHFLRFRAHFWLAPGGHQMALGALKRARQRERRQGEGPAKAELRVPIDQPDYGAWLAAAYKFAF